MIETDERGQQHLDDLLEAVDDCVVFSPWEQRFLMSIARIGYADLNRKQKAIVTDLYENYLGKAES